MTEPDDNEPITGQWLKENCFEYDPVLEQYIYTGETFELTIWDNYLGCWVCDEVDLLSFKTRRHVRLVVALFRECCS